MWGTNGSAVCFYTAHFEKVHFQLSKEFELDHMTGLLLIYPSCVLHIVEVGWLRRGPQNPHRIMLYQICSVSNSRPERFFFVFWKTWNSSSNIQTGKMLLQYVAADV